MDSCIVHISAIWVLRTSILLCLHTAHSHFWWETLLSSTPCIINEHANYLSCREANAGRKTGICSGVAGVYAEGSHRVLCGAGHHIPRLNFYAHSDTSAQEHSGQCALWVVCLLIWKIRSCLCNSIDWRHSEFCSYGWEGVKRRWLCLKSCWCPQGLLLGRSKPQEHTKKHEEGRGWCFGANRAPV